MSYLPELLKTVDEVIEAIVPQFGEPHYDLMMRLRVMHRMTREELAKCFPRPHICPECGEIRLDDKRVQAGTKCGICSYGDEDKIAEARLEAQHIKEDHGMPGGEK